jgi:hypothetical protein
MSKSHTTPPAQQPKKEEPKKLKPWPFSWYYPVGGPMEFKPGKQQPPDLEPYDFEKLLKPKGKK